MFWGGRNDLTDSAMEHNRPVDLLVGRAFTTNSSQVSPVRYTSRIAYSTLKPTHVNDQAQPMSTAYSVAYRPSNQ